MPAGPPGCWALPVERNTPLQARAAREMTNAALVAVPLKLMGDP